MKDSERALSEVLLISKTTHNGARPQAFSRSIRKNDPQETAQKNSDFMGGFAPVVGSCD
jgi:hypothetical protein